MWKYSYKCVVYLLLCVFCICYVSFMQTIYVSGNPVEGQGRYHYPPVVSPSDAIGHFTSTSHGQSCRCLCSIQGIRLGMFHRIRPKPISDSGVFQMMINCFDVKKATCFILGFSFIIPSNSLPRFHKGCDICSTIWRRFQITPCNHLSLQLPQENQSTKRVEKRRNTTTTTSFLYTPLQLTWPLKNGGCQTILSFLGFWEVNSLSGRVPFDGLTLCILNPKDFRVRVSHDFLCATKIQQKPIMNISWTTFSFFS